MTAPNAIADLAAVSQANDSGSVFQDVAPRAYEKWLSRCQHGDHQLLDWVEAESELALAAGLAGRLAKAQEALVPLLAERQEAQLRLVAEHAVSSILALAGTLSDAAPKLLQTIGECFAWDAGCVWIRDWDTDLLRHSEIWHVPHLQVQALEEDARFRTFSRGVGLPGRVWASESVVWMPNLAEDADFQRGQAAAIDGLRGAIGFPICNGTDFLGVLEFFSREMREPDKQMTETMASIGRQISQFVERRQAERKLHVQEHDRRIGREIQQGLLPHTMPRLPGLEISGRLMAPNIVGGDSFDFIPLPKAGPHCIGVVIADACGHGIGAALLAAATHAYIRGFGLTSADVSTLLRLTNRCLCESPSNQFVTAFMMRLDCHNRLLSYTGAGHPPGYVLDSGGNTREILYSTGFPLGILSSATFPAETIALEPGDLIFLSTDGVTEAASPDGELFGVERSLDLVRQHQQQTPDEILSALFDAVDEFCNHKFCDDVTAVIIKVNGVPSEEFQANALDDEGTVTKRVGVGAVAQVAAHPSGNPSLVA